MNGLNVIFINETRLRLCRPWACNLQKTFHFIVYENHTKKEIENDLIKFPADARFPAAKEVQQFNVHLFLCAAHRISSQHFPIFGSYLRISTMMTSEQNYTRKIFNLANI
jgi:hypothetical protein